MHDTEGWHGTPVSPRAVRLDGRLQIIQSFYNAAITIAGIELTLRIKIRKILFGAG
jgi:hypothetical protein